MKLYELIKQISNIITPDNNAFFNYVIHTSDDNGGFLRTRYCWWKDRPLKDKELNKVFKRVLVTCETEINIDDLTNEEDTLCKMQITYSIEDATVEDADWDIELDYCYVYIFDLESKSYTMQYVENPCR